MRLRALGVLALVAVAGLTGVACDVRTRAGDLRVAIAEPVDAALDDGAGSDAGTVSIDAAFDDASSSDGGTVSIDAQVIDGGVVLGDASVGDGASDGGIGITDASVGDAPVGDAPSDAGDSTCPVEVADFEETGDGTWDYPGDEIGCGFDHTGSVVARARLAPRAPPKGVDNKIKEAEKIEEARKNEKRHGELLEANRERVAAILETPSTMPPAGDKNPLGVTFERFKLAVEGNGSAERVALHFVDTPASKSEPKRSAKENQEQMGKDLKEAMAKINERLAKEGAEALGEYQFVIIGSGATFFSNNHDKAYGGTPKIFGQKTVDKTHNEKGTRADVDMDIHITCPTMVDYVGSRPHELNGDATRYLGPDTAIYNIFKSGGSNGVLTKYFPELQEVVTRWKDKLEIKEVELKLVTELEIKEIGPGPGPILLSGGP